jgi:hypothetical protein
MKLSDLYKFIIQEGMKEDPRGIARVKKVLKNNENKFKDLKPAEKKYFDRESLTNPYSDTRILYGSLTKDIESILLGIDMEAAELILADRLNSKGTKIDLVMAHHPEGSALAGLYNVMGMQADIVAGFGVNAVKAEKLLEERIHKVSRSLLPVNHTRAVDTARLLDMPFMCCHTPADNHVVTFLQKLMDKKKPENLKDIIDTLRDIPEYQESSLINTGPKIVNGKPASKAGRIFIDMTGGTEGSKEIFENLSQAGVGTVVGMHFSEDHLKKAKEAKVNMVIAGHISSDTLGLNLLLDKIEKKGKIKIHSCSGFYRIKR